MSIIVVNLQDNRAVFRIFIALLRFPFDSPSYNNAVVDNYGRLKDLILHFQIPMDTRKDFLEIYRQFGHAPSKSFTSPGL